MSQKTNRSSVLLLPSIFFLEKKETGSARKKWGEVMRLGEPRAEVESLGVANKSIPPILGSWECLSFPTGVRGGSPAEKWLSFISSHLIDLS